MLLLNREEGLKKHNSRDKHAITREGRGREIA